jgi:hypothetical protein
VYFPFFFIRMVKVTRGGLSTTKRERGGGGGGGRTVNASQKSIGSDLPSNLMCSKDCTSRNLQCSPTFEKLELLMNIFNNRRKNPI